jgi:hypothetical protein
VVRLPHLHAGALASSWHSCSSEIPIRACVDYAILPSHHVLDLDTIYNRTLFQYSRFRPRMRVNVLLHIGCIDPSEFVLVGHTCGNAFQNDHVVTIASMDNDPWLLHKVFGLLAAVVGSGIETGTISPVPDWDAVWTTIRVRRTDPDGALAPEG